MTDIRHGTVSAYVGPARCRCELCRFARKLQMRAYRKRRYLARGPLLIDSTGTARRVRALQAIGWPERELAARLGYAPGSVLGQKVRYGGKVSREVAARVVALYDELCMTPGPSAHSRRIAAAKGWLPPLAWDDETIDDPAYRPEPPEPVDLDLVVVDRLMPRDADWKALGATRAEREAAYERIKANAAPYADDLRRGMSAPVEGTNAAAKRLGLHYSRGRVA